MVLLTENGTEKCTLSRQNSIHNGGKPNSLTKKQKKKRKRKTRFGCHSLPSGRREGGADLGRYTIVGPTYWVPEITTIRGSVRGYQICYVCRGGRVEAGTLFLRSGFKLRPFFSHFLPGPKNPLSFLLWSPDPSRTLPPPESLSVSSPKYLSRILFAPRTFHLPPHPRPLYDPSHLRTLHPLAAPPPHPFTPPPPRKAAFSPLTFPGPLGQHHLLSFQPRA